MSFDPGLQHGEVITNDRLREIFKCSPQGGMRRSYKTKSLVLVSDRTNKNLYHDRWSEDGRILYYTGMGQEGNQSLLYSQNRTLMESNLNGVSIFLFEYRASNQYHFIDRVLLSGKPFREKQIDAKGNYRDVWMFPLISVGENREFIDFLSSFPINDLIHRKILNGNAKNLTGDTIIPLSKLMQDNRIDTLFGPGGWFFTHDLYFFNNNIKLRKQNQNGLTRKLNKNNEEEIISKLVFQSQNSFLNPFNKKSIVSIPDESIRVSDHLMIRHYTNNFRLLSLMYQDSTQPAYELHFLRDESKQSVQQLPYTTLLIGPNGTGKSTILSVIQKIFLNLIKLSSSSNIRPLANQAIYNLTYLLNGQEVRIEFDGKTHRFYVNGVPKPFSDVLLPNKLLVSASLVNDKFTFAKSDIEHETRYTYAGVRTKHNAAEVRAPLQRLATLLVESSLKEGFLENLKFMTSFLDLEPIIRIELQSKYFPISYTNHIEDNWYENLTNTDAREKFNKIEGSARADITKFFQTLNTKALVFFVPETDKSLVLELNLEHPEQYDEFIQDFQVLFEMLKNEIFVYKSIYVKKNEQFFDFGHASSGEQQFFSTMVTLLASIDQNSLVLIDEPEISLHPNWQYRYIDGLKKIFHQFPTTHFIMATHSHFMVADLEPSSSSIVSIERSYVDQNKINAILHEEKTYGWSAEDVLYNIFRMKTVRNFYLEQDLRELLYLISNKSTNLMRVGELTLKLEGLSLKDYDPLKLIILQAKGYLSNDSQTD